MQVEGLSKSFGGVHALKEVSLTFYAGEIHAVLGQNGAGKSTLVKLLTGIYPTNSAQGKIFLNGKDLILQDPSNALKQGIGYVPQEIELVDNLTVAENIFAGIRIDDKYKKFHWRGLKTKKQSSAKLFACPLLFYYIIK